MIQRIFELNNSKHGRLVDLQPMELYLCYNTTIKISFFFLRSTYYTFYVLRNAWATSDSNRFRTLAYVSFSFIWFILYISVIFLPVDSFITITRNEFRTIAKCSDNRNERRPSLPIKSKMDRPFLQLGPLSSIRYHLEKKDERKNAKEIKEKEKHVSNDSTFTTSLRGNGNCCCIYDGYCYLHRTTRL